MLRSLGLQHRRHQLEQSSCKQLIHLSFLIGIRAQGTADVPDRMGGDAHQPYCNRSNNINL